MDTLKQHNLNFFFGLNKTTTAKNIDKIIKTILKITIQSLSAANEGKIKDNENNSTSLITLVFLKIVKMNSTLQVMYRADVRAPMPKARLN